MEFDSVLSEIGEFGPWQRRTALLLFPCAMFAGIHNLLFTFTGGTILKSHKKHFVRNPENASPPLALFPKGSLL